MEARRILVLAALLGLATAAHIGNPDDVFADYHPEDRKLLTTLSKGWEEGWEKFLVPGPKPYYKDVVDQVHYLLWTRSNPTFEQELTAFDSSSFSSSNFDSSKDTYFEFHGFTVDGKTQWIIDSKNALLDLADVNVISVDYGELVPAPDYVSATANVYKTAELTGQLIDWMTENVGLDLKKTNLAGHSLGGHCAGMTGYYLTSGKAARVTGLDPAGPLFQDQDTYNRINPDSADFVDIIHSNGGDLVEGCLGLIDQLGDVDFYPNGGQHQVGCIDPDSSDILDLVVSCSHGRGPEYWTESIQAASSGANYFHSYPCSDWASYDAGDCTSCGNGCLDMGYPADISGVSIGATIEYYLRTNENSPFAQG